MALFLLCVNLGWIQGHFNFTETSLRYLEIPELKHTSTKFIKKALLNLTVTIDSWKRKTKKYIHSNFDAINTMILRHKWAISGSG